MYIHARPGHAAGRLSLGCPVGKMTCRQGGCSEMIEGGLRCRDEEKAQDDRGRSPHNGEERKGPGGEQIGSGKDGRT